MIFLDSFAKLTGRQVSFLETDGVKARIREVIKERQVNMERKAVWTVIKNIMGLLEHFPGSSFSMLLQPLLPQLMNAIQSVPSVEGPTTSLVNET